MLELQQRKVKQSVWRRVTSLGAFCFVIVLLSVSSPMATAAEEEIDVEVSDGIVTLDGSVESWAERELAEKVVKATRGVRAVRNNIGIEGGAVKVNNKLDIDP